MSTLSLSFSGIRDIAGNGSVGSWRGSDQRWFDPAPDPHPLLLRRRSVRRRTLLQDVGGLTYPEFDPRIPNSCFLVPHMDPNTLPLWGAVPREFSAAQTTPRASNAVTARWADRPT